MTPKKIGWSTRAYLRLFMDYPTLFLAIPVDDEVQVGREKMTEERIIDYAIIERTFEKSNDAESQWLLIKMISEPAPPTDDGVYIHKDGRWYFITWVEQFIKDNPNVKAPLEYLEAHGDKLEG
jgi:hypothetical protein